MARIYSELNDTHLAFIQDQHLFFTASAACEGRVNVSPKGMDSLRVLDVHTVAYLDLTGSGNETAAHIRDNGRLTIMFCSFVGNPLILRLYGEGKVVHPRDAAWPNWRQHFEDLPAERQIIVLHIETVQTSCGYGVPLFEYQGERETLPRWAEKKGEQGIRDYWREKNQRSIDGLPTGILED